MPFSDQVANGLYLVIPALRSPNYVAGASGWTLNQDGTAEVGNAVIRGSLLVTDPDGSFVHVYDQNPGDGAIIDLSAGGRGWAHHHQPSADPSRPDRFAAPDSGD
jgi:hypothetical protein